MKNTTWFDNLTPEKINQFLSFVNVIEESYIISDAIEDHEKEKRRLIANALSNMRYDIKTEYKNSSRFHLTFEFIGGKGAFLFFLKDMKKYFKEAIKYQDWDEEMETIENANNMFKILKKYVKGSFEYYYH